MAHERLADLRGYRMDTPAAKVVLERADTGTLALCADGETYAVPMSFGYDGDRCYFAFLESGEESRKVAFAAETDRACLTVTDTAGEEGDGDDWASVVARGPLDPVPEGAWDELQSALSANAWHPSLFGASSPMRGVTGYVLTVAELTGRHGSEYDPR
jgi:hypothetical protein